MDNIEQCTKKILLLGDGAVGKTSLIKRFVVDFFDDNYITTIGTKVTVKNMKIDLEDKVTHMKLQIWDVLGQKGYESLYHSSFYGAQGVMFIADVTRMQTFDSIKNYWIPKVRKIIGNVPFIILANKSDLITDNKFTYENLKEFASEYTESYYLTSAKNGDNVDLAFDSLGTDMIKFKGSPEPKFPEMNEIGDMTNPVALLIDKIINDFCVEYGRLEAAMPVIRKQFNMANLDINNPTEESLKLAVEMLADVELSYKSRDTAMANLRKRLKWIEEA
jgi:small GTP-binding protein